MNSRSLDRASWTTAWPDALAFAAGLVVAGMLGWRTTDLVWSLWLSSLVVGYATICVRRRAVCLQDPGRTEGRRLRHH